MSIEWGSLASWFSGLASFAAVGTALYLGSDSKRIKLRGYCGLRQVIGPGHPPKDLVFISATNIGTRAAIINNIGMTVGRSKDKKQAIITAVKDQCSDGVPVSIEDGQEAKWGIPRGENEQWLTDLVSGFVDTEDDADSLRFVIYTTHGAAKEITPEDALIKRIKELVRAKNA